MEIRDARPADLPGILVIYNEVIETSTAIYADDTVGLADREAWFADRLAGGFPVLVATDATGVTGYASFVRFRPHPGYRYTVEHSVHIRGDQRGRGVGKALMEALIPRARAMGMHVMVAAIDAANAGSIRFHERLGFELVGSFPEIGRKFGRWLDLACMQLILDEPGSARTD